jgi:hypothetical protein
MAKRDRPKFFDYLLRRYLLAESFANGVGLEVNRLINKDVFSLIEEINSFGKSKTFNKTKLDSTIKSLGSILNKTQNKYLSKIQESAVSALASEYDAVSRRLLVASGIKLKKSPYKISEVKVNSFLKAPIANDYLENWVSNSISAIGTTIRRDLVALSVGGESVATVASILPAYENIGIKGAQMLSRTMIASSVMAGRDSVFEDNSDLIAGYEFVAVLDNRTSVICLNHDGRRSPDLLKLPQPPLHINCRSSIIPLMGSDMKLPSNRGRGRDFFESQSDEWQLDFLGPTRYEAFKEGLIDLKELSKNDKVVPVSALKTRAERRANKG